MLQIVRQGVESIFFSRSLATLVTQADGISVNAGLAVVT